MASRPAAAPFYRADTFGATRLRSPPGKTSCQRRTKEFTERTIHNWKKSVAAGRRWMCEWRMEDGGVTRQLTFLCIVFFLTSLLKIGNTTAVTSQSPDDLLTQIVERTVEITRSHGYPFPRYVVRNGGTDLPISEARV